MVYVNLEIFAKWENENGSTDQHRSTNPCDLEEDFSFSLDSSRARKKTVLLVTARTVN